MKFKLTSALVIIVLASCSASPDGGNVNPPGGGSSGERLPGTLLFYGDPAQIEVPSDVSRGKPFTVTVVTYGGICIHKGETVVEVEASRAEVRPYDYDISSTLPANSACTADLKFHRHTAMLSFEEAGTAEVIFYGRQEDSSGVSQTTVTRTLEVR